MNKKLAVISPSFRGGGGEGLASDLSDSFRRKFKTKEITYNLSEENKDVQNRIELNIKKSKNPISKLKYLIKGSKRLKEIKQKNDIDISVSFLIGPNLMNILSNSSGLKILTVHTMKSEQKTPYGKFYGYLVGLLYNKADLIVTPSKGIKRDLVENYSINEKLIKIIPNPIDIERVRRIKDEDLPQKYKKIFKENKIIINVGRLNWVKGQWHLIKAFNRLKKDFPESKLLFLGKGNLKEGLVNLAKKLGIEEDVYFLGYKENPFKFVSRADVFALTSLSEGFGKVVLESLSCGTSVISTGCAGPVEMLSPDRDKNKKIENLELAKFGIITPKPSKNSSSNVEENLSRGIKKLLDDRKLRGKYEKKGIKRAKNFNVKNIIPKWAKIISSI